MLAVISKGIVAIASRSRSATVAGLCVIYIGDHEFLSTRPADHGGGAAVPAKRRGDGDKRLIARGVAMHIIELLEVVEIDHRDHQI
jgi:hypothetical protein